MVYTVQTVSAIALHLNLALTGLCAFLDTKTHHLVCFLKPLGLL